MTPNKSALWASTAARGGMSSFVRTMQDTKLWEDWNIRLVSTHRNGTVWSRIAIFVVALFAFIADLILHRPDVVHLHTAGYGSFVRKGTLAWISTLFRLPFVLHVHGSEFHIFFAGAPRPFQFVIRLTLERADALIALGDAWAFRLQAIAPKARIIVMPNAIRPDAAVNQRIDGPVSVAFLGEIGDRKGTFTLIDAWAKVVDAAGGRTRALLTIAGDGEVGRARSRVGDLKLNASVKVHGWMASSDVQELLTKTQVLVLPSRDEGQPMAILEAMAKGLCVVASNVGGIPEMLSDDCGVLVLPDNVDELAEALLYVIDNQDVRESLGCNALHRIRDQFDIDVVSRRLDGLYRELVESP